MRYFQYLIAGINYELSILEVYSALKEENGLVVIEVSDLLKVFVN